MTRQRAPLRPVTKICEVVRKQPDSDIRASNEPIHYLAPYHQCLMTDEDLELAREISEMSFEDVEDLKEMVGVNRIYELIPLYKWFKHFNNQFAATTVGGKFRIIDQNSEEVNKDFDKDLQFMEDTHFMKINAVNYVQVYGYRPKDDENKIYKDRKREVSLIDSKDDPTYEDRLKQHKFYLDQLYVTGKVSAAVLWLKWSKRRQYNDGVDYLPHGNLPASVYNMFRGLRYLKKEDVIQDVNQAKEWSNILKSEVEKTKFYEHLRDNICNGDNYNFQWVMAWLGSIFREPTNRPSSALVLTGDSGAGKSMIGKVMREMLGEVNYLSLGKTKEATTNFNDVNCNRLLISCEEAFFAGSKETADIMKNLISNDRILLEKKNIDAIKIKNFTRYIFTTNSEWVINACANERRYFVLKVGLAKQQNNQYFIEMESELKANEGRLYKVWSDYLANYIPDEDINLNKPPKTDAFKTQVIHTLSAGKRWFYDAVHGDSGYFAEMYDDAGNLSYKDDVIKDDVFTLYEEYCLKLGQRHEARINEFDKIYSKLFPENEPNKYGAVRKRTLSKTYGKRQWIIYLPMRKDDLIAMIDSITINGS